MKFNLEELSVTEILKLYSDVMFQLAYKNITSSSNNPVADYTENLVCEALSLDKYRQSTGSCNDLGCNFPGVGMSAAG